MRLEGPFPVLMVHNYYSRAMPSGENLSFEDETRLLEEHGHDVHRYTCDMDHIRTESPLAKMSLATRTVWSRRVRRELETVLRRRKMPIAHFQNTFPLISPAAYYAAKAAGCAVVQSLRNYRLLCVNAQLQRDNAICEQCVGHIPWRGVQHACYRDSRAASAVVAAMLTVHRMLRTWDRMVDLYVATSEFTRSKLVEAGFPAGKIVVKPNFVHPDLGPGKAIRRFGLFAGRFTAEKGVSTLLGACERLSPSRAGHVVLAGDGPLSPNVREAVGRRRVAWLGTLSGARVRELMGEASFVVVPSEWYEPFGRVVVEAFSRGTPVIAARIGALTELVDEGRTGLFFRPGDTADLAAKMEWALANRPELAQMGARARQVFEARYTAEANYRQLVDVYDLAVARATGRAPALEGAKQIAAAHV